MAEGAVGGFGQQAAAPGNAPPAPKPLKTSANGIVIIKATSHDPWIVVLASEVNRIPKRMWMWPVWEQRMSIMRRLGEFTKAHGPEMSEGHVQLFIVSLKLAKSSAVQYAGTLLSPMAARKVQAQVFLPGLQRLTTENPARQARQMVRCELSPVCNAMVSERDCVAMRFAWVMASCCGEIALLKENFIELPCDQKGLIVDWAALPRTFEADPHTAARCVVRAAAPTIEHSLYSRILTLAGKHVGPLGLPRTAVRSRGHWSAIWNNASKLTALM
ncbi:hypothetical protein ERJ75_001588500 [Trypanosoma vivax]|uniref:Uncharacterized protein n=1 Tax=Trypanosoma vivax (strain Y486) TaxID=1055687 RepID=G0TS81_TRYVY|nr:hypothetical protein ERJ75_001588500 [Trypanosoma vivax]CCC46807.1 conserved hypothetical protein, in T. vivax [Trypanosoma vivax Y486]